MFAEYLRILNASSDETGLNYYQALFKLAIIASVGLVLIYLGYKLLGKFGAISVFVFEVIIFAIANDWLPFHYL